MNIDPNSAGVVSKLAADVAAALAANPSLQGIAYDAIITVPSTQPKVSVTPTNHNLPKLDAYLAANGGWPIPPTAQVSGGSNDRYMAVQIAGTQLCAEFWGLSDADPTGARTYSYGGITDCASTLKSLSQDGTTPKAPACYAPGCWQGNLDWEMWVWGPSAGSLYLPQCDPSATVFANALNGSAPMTNSSLSLWVKTYVNKTLGWTYPAQGSDGDATDPTTFNMVGDRFKLPTGYNLSAITDPAALVICRDVLRDGGGFIVHDRNWGTPEIRFARADTGEPAWSTLIPNARKTYKAIPWSDLVLLGRNVRTAPGPQ